MSYKSGEFKWALENLRHCWSRYLASIAAAVSTSIMALVDPLVLGWVIDAFIKSRSMSVPLIGACVVMVAYEIRLWLSAFSSFWAADTYQELVLRLRVKLLEHFDRLSLDYHETTTLGAKSFILIDCVDDIAVVGAEVVPLLAKSIISGIVAFITMVVISPQLSLVLLSSLPVYILTTRHFKRQIRSNTESANNALDRMSQYVHEHLAVIPQIQALLQESREIGEASKLLHQVKHNQTSRVVSEMHYTIGNGTVTALTSAITLGYGVYLARIGAMSIGHLVVCYSYLARLFEPIGSIAGAYAKLQKSASSIRRLQQFLEIQPSVTRPLYPKPIHADSIRLACDGITFSYMTDRSAVCNLTFALEPRERISIVGRSGAGKSTVAKLIARLYDPQSGIVSINGEDIRSVDIPTVRRLIHYMPQHAVLFTGTVEENLCYGNVVVTSSDLQRVIEMVHLQPVIRRMPRGLQEALGPGGGQLSGGERQRLALARAILQRPSVLILDEATAFLDAALEAEIFENLRACLSDMSLILISHRLSTLKWVDRHILIDQGTVIGSGRHDRLHRESRVYRELYETTHEQTALIESVPTTAPPRNLFGRRSP